MHRLKGKMAWNKSIRQRQGKVNGARAWDKGMVQGYGTRAWVKVGTRAWGGSCGKSIDKCM